MTEPNWDDIHEPAKFFQLDEGYDRKTLKRAYTKLIKQYKPEKFPDEFQKIRAAYEELEEELAYGVRRTQDKNETHTFPSHKDISVELDLKNEEGKLQDSDLEEFQETTKSFIEQIQEKGKSALLKDLREKENKRPEEFLALAILEEEESQDPLKFLNNILAGLKIYHSQAELNEALFQFCRTEYPLETIPGILEMIRQASPDFSYFYLTEELWKTLLKKDKVSDFTSTFKILEMKPSDQISNYCIFLIRIIKEFYFKFPKEWLERQYAFIDENIFSLGDDWDYELDFIEMLKSYDEKLEDFLTVHDYREKIHETIKNCLELDYHYGELAFLDLQNEMIQLKNWAEVFPFEDNSAEACLTLLSHIQYFYLESDDEDGFDESESGAVRFKLHEFSRKMDSQFNKGLEGNLLNFMATFYWIFHIAISLVIFAILGAIFDLFFNASEVKTVFAFIFISIYLAYIRPTYLDKYKNELFIKLASKSYNKRIRHHIISLFLELQISEKAFYNHLHTLNESDDELVSPYYILMHLNEDFAPSFAAISAKFQ